MTGTGYKLPFRFELSEPSLLFRRPARIRVRAHDPDAAAVISQTLRTFADAAQAGCFGDAQIPPWDTGLALTPQPSPDPCDLLFSADACNIAPQAWIVLCHLLLRVHQDKPLKLVQVLGDGDTTAAPVPEISESSYPARYQALPFALDDTEPEGGGYSFYIQMRAPLQPENEAALNHHLMAWTRLILRGGYASAPLDPASDYVEPDSESVDSYDNIVEWAVFKLCASPDAAIAGLVNLFAHFHQRSQAIMSVEIG